mgnify:CR=1 FL=1
MTLFFSIRVLIFTCKILIKLLLGIQNCAWMAFQQLVDLLHILFLLFENISLIYKRHHCHKGLLNLGLCSAPMGFEQEGNFIVPCFVCLFEFYVPLEKFSLIWRRHLCRWRAANFYLCSALIAMVFSMTQLLWHWAWHLHLLPSFWQWSCPCFTT